MNSSQKNLLIKKEPNGSAHSDLTLDIRVTDRHAPTIIFVHGFKGFKDWGCWSLVEDFFVKHGFNFVKFNFSKNGTTSKNLLILSDLDSFAENTFSIECKDLERILNYLEHSTPLKDYYLIGHSLGGGITLITAKEDRRVKQLATWASISNFDKMFSGFDLKKWEKEKVTYIENQRTQQLMPLNYSLYLDYLDHQARFDLKTNLVKIDQPTLVVHGENDPTVSVESAHIIYKKLSPHIRKDLYLLPSNHNFDSSHPWDHSQLPLALEKVCLKTQSFFKEQG